ncbi:hypothetical protein B0T24DRAFT_596307 [Lasiosphaeria ovina]|uniref:GPI inositol-deacylase winged helix domain-containing protein n=1 Tax=Lasiosphaeria ovina TaxID=92902 RepID=A0AAE0N4Y2_9PEZI|nr:hypothetical protein B0T24DRAFT_596307 [Lasiosphaeria ovina]
MFLFARVVLDNLMLQGSEDEFEEEMSGENFPEGLESVYERVAVRVLDRAPRNRREAAAKILGWAVCAARPLRWKEIQSLFCTDVDQGTCNFKKQRVDSCKTICSSLVDVAEIGPEATISLVHESARRYLVHTNRIEPIEEHIRMANLCAKYLTTEPFCQNQSPQDLEDNARTGYYGFQDYAAPFWNYHVEVVVKQGRLKEVAQSAIGLLKSYHGLPTNERGLTEDISPDDIPTKEFENMATSGPCTWLFTSPKTSLEERVMFTREVLETLYFSVSLPNDRAFFGLYGDFTFKCPKLQCSKFTSGFPNKASRDSHVHDHDMPYKCPDKSCYGQSIGYSAPRALKRHLERSHSSEIDRPLFPTRSPKHPRTFFEACASGNLEASKEFLRTGVDINHAKTRNSVITPLQAAVRGGHVQVCLYLLSQGAFNKHPKGLLDYPHEIIKEAMRRNDPEILRIILDRCSKKIRNEVVDSLATRYGKEIVGFTDPESLGLFLSWIEIRNLGVRARLQQALTLSVEPIEKYEQFFDTLGLRRRVERPGHGSANTADAKIIETGALGEQAAYSLIYGCANGQTLLHRSYRFKIPLKACLGRISSQDINQRTRDGDTVLHLAALNGQDDVVRLLVETGWTDIMARNRRGMTAFSLAASCTYAYGSSDGAGARIMKLFYDINPLLAQIADEGRDGYTPLRYALNVESKINVGFLLTLPEAKVLVRAILPVLQPKILERLSKYAKELDMTSEFPIYIPP